MIFIIIRKHFLYILFLSFLLLTSGCQLRDPAKTHGINFIENREKQLTVNQTNKNDTIKILGQPHIVSMTNDNIWIYVERVTTKGGVHTLGKEVLLKNNILELKYNKYGILETKNIYRKQDMKKISFNEKATINDISKESFVSGLLQSLKEKMYGQNKF